MTQPGASPHSGMNAAVLTAVAAGGALGSLGRYAVGLAIPRSAGGFPWGTLLVNVSGALLMGLLVAWLVIRPGAHPLARPFVGVGLLGGWTTYSALAVESVELIRGGSAGIALAYLVMTFTLGILAVLAGTLVGARLLAPASDETGASDTPADLDTDDEGEHR